MLDKLKVCLRFLLYIIIIEAVLGGAGRLFVIGHLSFRMILYVFAFLLFIICAFFERKDVINKIKNIDLKSKIILIFIFWIIISAINGYLNKNSLVQIEGDVTGYAGLLLLILFNYLVDDKFKVDFVAKLITYSSIVQSFIILVIHYLIGLRVLDVNSFNNTLQYLYIGHLALIVPDSIRIFFKSAIYLQIGFVFLFGMIVNERSRKRKLILNVFLCVISYAIILTFTRGFWVAAFVALLIYLFLHHFKGFIKVISITLCGIIVLLGLSYAAYGSNDYTYSIVDRFTIAFNKQPSSTKTKKQLKQSDDQSEDMSLQYRDKLVKAMFGKIDKSPVLGNGFGVVLKSIGQTESRCEYMFLDIIMEMGIIGLIIYAGLFVVLVSEWIKIRRRSIDKDKLFILDAYMCSFIGVIITSAINPYLNNPIGITFLVAAICSVNIYGKEKL